MRAPMISEIAKNTYAINEYGMTTMFLLVGEERALLLDAGVSVCPLKEIVETLTDKPYDVVLTHAHGDHDAGAPQFKRVYVHKDDVEGLKNSNPGMIRGYIDMMNARGSSIYGITPEDVKIYDAPPEEIIPIEEGHVFHLGGRDVEVIHTPGHTVGSICFLDPYSRILFSGDACNVNLGLVTDVTTALRGLEKLDARRGEFDRNFNSHVGYGGNQNCYSMPDRVLDDCLYICRSILDGTAQVQHNPHMQPAYRAYFVEYGKVRIAFNPNKLTPED